MNYYQLESLKQAGKKHSKKIIASFITLAVLTVLLLAGPANAFNVSLTGFAVANPEDNDKISTTASVTINSNDRMPLPNPLSVMVDGIKVCSFSINVVSTDCDSSNGVNIDPISSSSSFGYGYGYGYGYQYGYNYGYQEGYGTGTFTYNLTLDTSKFLLGDHKIQLTVDAGNNHIYSSKEQSITINPEGSNSTDTETSVPGTEESFDNNVKITLNGTENARITVSEFSSQPNETSTFSIPALGKFYQIESNTSNIGETTIKVSYTDDEVTAAGLDEGTLQLYFFNSTSGTWELPLASGVDTVNNFIWAKTNHFSIWGAFGSAPVVDRGSGITSSGAAPSAGGSTITPTTPAQTQEKTNNPTDETTPAQTSTQGFFSGITGAVTGALGKTGSLIVIIFVVLVAVLLIIVLVKRASSKKETKKKK